MTRFRASISYFTVVLAVPVALVACKDDPAPAPPAATTTAALASSAPTPPPPASSAAPMPKPRMGHWGPGGQLLSAAHDLTLKDDQKTKLDAIEDGLKPDPAAARPGKELGAVHDDLVAGVKAGKIDTAKVDSDWDTAQKAMQPQLDKEADALNQLHGLLDATQRKALTAAIRAKTAERDAKMAEHAADKKKDDDKTAQADHQKKILDKMTKDLGLDDGQQKKVAALLAKQPAPTDWQKNMSDMEKKQDALLTAFEGETFDAKKQDALKIDAKKMKEPLDRQEKFLSDLLGIVKPEQRDAVAKELDRKRGGMGGPMGGPMGGRHGMGGPGGPGMGGPGMGGPGGDHAMGGPGGDHDNKMGGHDFGSLWDDPPMPDAGPTGPVAPAPAPKPLAAPVMNDPGPPSGSGSGVRKWSLPSYRSG